MFIIINMYPKRALKRNVQYKKMVSMDERIRITGLLKNTQPILFRANIVAKRDY